MPIPQRKINTNKKPTINNVETNEVSKPNKVIKKKPIIKKPEVIDEIDIDEINEVSDSVDEEDPEEEIIITSENEEPEIEDSDDDDSDDDDEDSDDSDDDSDDDDDEDSDDDDSDDDDEDSDDSDDDEEDSDDDDEEDEPIKTVKKKTKPIQTSSNKKTSSDKNSSSKKKSTKPNNKATNKTTIRNNNIPDMDEQQYIAVRRMMEKVSFDTFINNYQNGKFNFTLEKSSATRNEFAKITINKLIDILDDEENENRKYLRDIFNFRNINANSMGAIINLVEEAFMELIKSQTTFTWGYNPDDGSRLSLRRRTISGRVIDTAVTHGAKYVPFYSEMKISYNINKKVFTGKYNKKTDTFIDGETKKKHIVSKENEEAIKKDKQEFPGNYPKHLTKK